VDERYCEHCVDPIDPEVGAWVVFPSNGSVQVCCRKCYEERIAVAWWRCLPLATSSVAYLQRFKTMYADVRLISDN
jgi:hypothetical protein